MKLIKKLMPFATLASAVAITTPLVTSCSGCLVSTSDFEYKPGAIHGAESIKLSETDKIKALKEDYFKDSNKIAQDILYAKARNYKEAKAKLLEKHSDSGFSFTAKVKSFNIKETKQITVTVAGETRQVLGYVFDYETEYNRSYWFTLKNVTYDSVKYNEIKFTSEAHETDIAKNVFAFLWYNGSKLTMHCALLDIVSDQWLWEDHECGTLTTDWTYSNGQVVTDEAKSELNQYYSKETGLFPTDRYWDMYKETQPLLIDPLNPDHASKYVTVTTDVGSYYMSDITFDWQN